MNVVRWNPFAELDEFFGRRQGGNGWVDGQGWRPAVDIRETDENYLFEVELPAMDPKDVDVTLRAGVLSVAGERSVEAGDGQMHRQERLHGKFTRSFRLPTDADDEAISASAKDGVITVAVGKRSKAKPRAIEVRAA
ncbi:MAG: Hsp20/alpha crystallin family protein [Gammaproteobacteria bacterium]|nr:Hsp20/alpha crystallin family protein [Gammaproteobacteria bacterium]